MATVGTFGGPTSESADSATNSTTAIALFITAGVALIYYVYSSFFGATYTIPTFLGPVIIFVILYAAYESGKNSSEVGLFVTGGIVLSIFTFVIACLNVTSFGKQNSDFFWNASDGSLHYPEWNPLVTASDPIPVQKFSWEGVVIKKFPLDETTVCKVTIVYRCAAKPTYANAKAIYEGADMELRIANVLDRRYLPMIKADAERLYKRSPISDERIVDLGFLPTDVDKNIVWLEPTIRCTYLAMSDLSRF